MAMNVPGPVAFRSPLTAALAGLLVAAMGCDKVPSGAGVRGDPCNRNVDCNAPLLCIDAVCQPDPKLPCVKNAKRCNGNDIETCVGDAGDGINGDSWTIIDPAVDRCAAGCLTEANGFVTCRPQICTPFATRCAPVEVGVASAIQQCDGAGARWNDLFVCATACQLVGEVAQCEPAACEPFSKRCREGDPTTLEVCSARGTRWEASPCEPVGGVGTTCENAACVRKVCSPEAGGATANQQLNPLPNQRCRGAVAERCNGSGTAFVTREVCNNGCVYDDAADVAVCPPQVCTPLALAAPACSPDGGFRRVCNAFGTAVESFRCEPGTHCIDGICRPKACAVTVEPSGQRKPEARCRGTVIERCNDAETNFELAEICAFGCSQATGEPACVTPNCELGEVRCSPDGALLACNDDRLSLDFVRYCAAGCEAVATRPPSARCLPTFCEPLARRCLQEVATTLWSVEICTADGARFQTIEACAQGCSAGLCSSVDAGCSAGTTRCTGATLEVCTRLANGATEWRWSDECTGACVNSECLGGAGVGCAGGTGEVPCGAEARPVFPVKSALPPGEALPCDGWSRLLVVAGPLASSTGAPVPDGTPVTFALDGVSAALGAGLGSLDARPAVPGLQRLAFAGHASVLLTAPTSCLSTDAPATVTATVGGRALASAAVPLVPAGGNVAYVADDYTSTATWDRSSTAILDPPAGFALGLAPFDLGTGRDGEYLANDGAVHDLAAEGYAPAWRIAGITGSTIVVDPVLPTLSSGDEVLVTTLWSSDADTVGRYELHRVASVEMGLVHLEEPVVQQFGRTGNDDFVDVHAVVQRVPHFSRFVVGADAVLTATAPVSGLLSDGSLGVVGGGTGLIAFRVRGEAVIDGRIDLTARGIPAEVLTTPAPSGPGRLMLGRAAFAGGGRSGGGALAIAAGVIDFTVSPVTALVTVQGESGGEEAGAGTIRLQAGRLVTGDLTPRLFGGAGGVFLDYGVADPDPLSVPAPMVMPAVPVAAIAVGQGGPLFAVSSPRSLLPLGANVQVSAATLVGFIGGASRAVRLPVAPMGLDLPEIRAELSADDGANYVPLAPDALFPSGAGPLRWRVGLVPFDDRPIYLQGLALRLELVR